MSEKSGGRYGDKWYCLTGYIGGAPIRKYRWAYSAAQAKMRMKEELAKDRGLEWVHIEEEWIEDITHLAKNPA